MSFNSNTTGVTTGAGTAIPSRAPEFTPGFQWGSCCSIVFCVVFYRLLGGLGGCSFCFDHCNICPTSIYSFWYLQILLVSVS